MRFRTEKERMTDTSVFHGKTAKYMTLGCKLNFSETATFARTLYNMGVGEANAGEAADICLINTCSVTEMADHKCRQQIHKMVRENPLRRRGRDGLLRPVEKRGDRPNPWRLPRAGQQREGSPRRIHPPGHAGPRGRPHRLCHVLRGPSGLPPCGEDEGHP